MGKPDFVKLPKFIQYTFSINATDKLASENSTAGVTETNTMYPMTLKMDVGEKLDINALTKKILSATKDVDKDYHVKKMHSKCTLKHISYGKKLLNSEQVKKCNNIVDLMEQLGINKKDILSLKQEYIEIGVEIA